MNNSSRHSLLSLSQVIKTYWKDDPGPAAKDWNIRFFLSYQLFAHLEFFNGLFAVYLAHHGVGSRWINICLVCTTAARTLGEVPSGYLGDRVGDRPMLFAGTMLMMLFSLGMLLPLSVPLLIGLFICHGLSIASTSGADDGILYRTVLRGDNDSLEKLRPISVGLNYVSLGIAAVLGGMAAEYGGWRMVFWGFAASALVAMMSLALIRGPSVVTEREADEATTLSSIYRTIIKYPRLCFIVTLFALIEACANVVFIYAQLRSANLGFALLTIGLSMGAVEAASAAGAFSSRFITVGTLPFRFCLTLLALSLATSCLATGSYFIAAILAFLFLATLLKVLGETLLVTEIDTALTATALSLFSLIISLFTGLLHLLFAILGDCLKETNILTVLSCLSLVAALFLLSAEKPEHQEVARDVS